MLRFFRLNDPYRLLAVFVLLLAVRLPVWIGGDTVSLLDIHALLVGEKMEEGNRLYAEIWANTGPLAGFVYFLLDWMVGRSIMAHNILSYLLVCFQCVLFNYILISTRAFGENTYIPAFLYGLFMSAFFGFYSLSPVLMALTFMLMALRNTLRHMELKEKNDEKIFNIGLYMAIASMFYLPLVFFFPGLILLLVLFSGTIPRRYFLLLYGFLLPFMGLFSYHFYFDSLDDLWYCWVLGTFTFPTRFYLDIPSVLMILSVPILYLVVAIGIIINRSRFTSFQSVVLQCMLIWMLVGGVYLVFVPERKPDNLLVFVPPAAFLITHMFLFIRRKLWAEISFLLMVVMVVLVNLGTYFGFFFTADIIDYQPIVAKELPWAAGLEGKKILILGEDISGYQRASLATGFLDWRLAGPLLQRPGYYDNLQKIMTEFEKDPPEVVVDPQGHFPVIQAQIPRLQASYEARGQQVYFLRP